MEDQSSTCTVFLRISNLEEIMIVLKIKGARNSTLAFHRCATYAEVEELLAVYRALGYADTAFVVEKTAEEQAA
jgi:hypothetical protein